MIETFPQPNVFVGNGRVVHAQYSHDGHNIYTYCNAESRGDRLLRRTSTTNDVTCENCSRSLARNARNTAVRDALAAVENPPTSYVIVVRRAYTDCPDRVLSGGERDYERMIEKYYPGAVIDKCGGFDTPDGGSYVYDTSRVDN